MSVLAPLRVLMDRSIPVVFDMDDVGYLVERIFNATAPMAEMTRLQWEARHADSLAYEAEMTKDFGRANFNRDYAKAVRLACLIASWKLDKDRVVISPSSPATPRVDISALKKSIDLVNYIDQYVRLVKRGSHFYAPCPFHDDKTPSFCVWPDHWKCFGCGAGGDIVTFVQLWHKTDFKGAVEILQRGQ